MGMSDRGKANATLHCRARPSSVGISKKGTALPGFHWRGVFVYPSLLGILKFPAVVCNNGLLVKTYLESPW